MTPIPGELRLVPRRDRRAHKGDFGRILIVGGSYGMHGAAVLTAAAAFRSGAGLVTVALPETIYAVAGAAEIRATYLPLPVAADNGLSEASLELLYPALAIASVVVIGPGLGLAPSTTALVRRLVSQVPCPLVVDADGLNAFAGEPALIAGNRPATIITPHPGELARLRGKPAGKSDAERRSAAIDLAMRTGGTVILKGFRSVVTNGIDAYFNESGNPGMATAGSGDVLSGCVAALFAVLQDPLQTARVAAFAHGRAGDLAAAGRGEIGTTATDLLDCLPQALSEMTAS